jgi:hypothetical protein
MRLSKNNAWDPRLKPYGALDTERLQITGTGVWKAEKYLSDEFWMPYIEIRALEFKRPIFERDFLNLTAERSSAVWTFSERG